MEPFEEKLHRGRRRQIRLLLALPTIIALVLGGLIYLFTYHINQFRMEVELYGQSHMVLEYGEYFEDPGARAKFYGTHLVPEGIFMAVDREGQVDEAHVGSYEIRYSAVHEKWRDEKVRTVEIVDTKPPVIWLAETPGSYVLPGHDYIEEGYIAQDGYDGDLTDRVNRSVLNDRIVYWVEDSSGNKAEVVRPIVYYDPEPPVLTLLGDETVKLTQGQAYKEPGFTATDNCDGELTHKVQVSGSIDTNRPGTYKLYYSVKDSFGNEDVAVRTVEVKAKKKPKPQQSEVTPSGKVIYLTFDDGPSKYTPELLAILKKYNVKATFFVAKTGYSHLIGDIVDQGHAIGAHTYTHDYSQIYSSDEAYFEDFNKILNLIKKESGVSTKLLRFPGGSSNTVSRICEGIMGRIANELVDRGYRYFDWNVDSNDAGGAKTADKVYENVINGVQNRRVSIVLQHDTKGYSVEAVEKIIIWGLENGYKFLPLKSNSPTAAHDIRN